MFCPNCGAQNSDSNAFCLNCGTPLKPLSVPAPVPAPTPESTNVAPTQEPKPTPEIKKPQPSEENDTKPENPIKPTPEQEPVEMGNDEDETTTDALTESERKASKLLIPSVIVALILILGGGAYLGHCLEWWRLPFLKNSYSSTEKLDFVQLSGEETRRLEGYEIDSSFSYSIAWPVGTDEEVVTTLQNWVIEQVSGNEPTENRDIDEIIKKAAESYFEGEQDYSKDINIIYERDYPFESLLTMRSHTQVYRYSDFSNICVNLKNGQVFDGENAIYDTEGMRQLIIKNLQDQFEKDNIDWESEILGYTPETLPMPQSAPVLTPDGVEFTYKMYEIASGAAGMFVCCIPYDDAVPALTEQAKSFLPESIIDSAEAKAREMEAAKDEAIKFLYQTYYDDEIINTNDGRVGSQGYGYSESIRNKFRELGITSGLYYPIYAEAKEGNDLYQPYYTKDLNNLLKKYCQKADSTDDFELMLMVYGEFEGGDPFDLEIRDVEVISPSKVTLKVTETDCYEMDVVLVKEDGKWYIDDISGYRQREQYILN